MVNIAHILCSEQNGGLERAFLNTSEALKALGHKVTILAPQGAPYLAEIAPDMDYRPLNSRGFHSVIAAYQLRRYIKAQNFDLVVTHAGRATSMARYALKGLHIPHIGFAHNDRTGRMLGLNRIVVLTAHMRDIFLKAGYGNSRIHILPNMVLDYPEAPLPLPNLSGNLRLGFIGRLVPVKGLSDLLSSLARIKNELPPFTLHVAGSGGDASLIAAQAARLGLADNIHFDGWINDIRSWLENIDLVVLPSHSETFGIVITEAHMHGRPVVTTATAGSSVQVTDRVNGWVALPANPGSLASTLTEAVSAREKWPSVITSGFESAQAYKVGNLLPELENIINNSLI